MSVAGSRNCPFLKISWAWNLQKGAISGPGNLQKAWDTLSEWLLPVPTYRDNLTNVNPEAKNYKGQLAWEWSGQRAGELSRQRAGEWSRANHRLQMSEQHPRSSEEHHSSKVRWPEDQAWQRTRPEEETERQDLSSFHYSQPIRIYKQLGWAGWSWGKLQQQFWEVLFCKRSQ